VLVEGLVADPSLLDDQLDGDVPVAVVGHQLADSAKDATALIGMRAFTSDGRGRSVRRDSRVTARKRAHEHENTATFGSTEARSRTHVPSGMRSGSNACYRGDSRKKQSSTATPNHAFPSVFGRLGFLRAVVVFPRCRQGAIGKRCFESPIGSAPS